MRQHQLTALLLGWLLLDGGFIIAAQAQDSPFPLQKVETSIVGPAHEVVLTLEASDYPSYSRLMQQAQQVTTHLIQRAFNENPNWSVVNVHILGSHRGNVLPLMVTQVSRSDWQTRPDVDYWGQSTGLFARLLLGLDPDRGQSGASGVAVASESMRPVGPTPRGRSSRLRRILTGEAL
jgi:hypothetical protein